MSDGRTGAAPALNAANDVLAFALEIAALVLLGVWGFTVAPNTVLAFVLGLGAPLLFVLVWGAFLAPRARRRLRMPGLLVAKLAAFLVAAAAAWSAGLPGWAAVLAVLAVVHLTVAARAGRV